MSGGEKQARFRQTLAAMGERRVGWLVRGRAWPATRLGWAQVWLAEQPGAIAALLAQKAVARRARRRWGLALALAAGAGAALLAWAVVA